MEKAVETKKPKTLDDVERDLYNVMGTLAVANEYAYQNENEGNDLIPEKASEALGYIRNSLTLCYEALERIQEDIEDIRSQMEERKDGKNN